MLWLLFPLQKYLGSRTLRTSDGNNPVSWSPGDQLKWDLAEEKSTSRGKIQSSRKEILSSRKEIQTSWIKKSNTWWQEESCPRNTGSNSAANPYNYIYMSCKICIPTPEVATLKFIVYAASVHMFYVLWNLCHAIYDSLIDSVPIYNGGLEELYTS